MNWDYFFVKENEAPPEYLWEAYCWQHFAWLIAMGIICAISCYFFRKATPEKQSKVLKAIAIWILIQEILKDILYYYADNLEWDLLPLHICGISIFFTLWYAFKPGDLNGAYIYGVSLPGALSALLFPNWTWFPLFHFSSINSFTIHGELILFAMLALTSGRLKPKFREIPKLTIIMVDLAIPIYFLNKVLDTNFMFINFPSPGSPLIPLYNVFGDFYVVAAVPLLVLIWVVLFLPWWFQQEGRNKRDGGSCQKF